MSSLWLPPHLLTVFLRQGLITLVSPKPWVPTVTLLHNCMSWPLKAPCSHSDCTLSCLKTVVPRYFQTCMAQMMAIPAVTGRSLNPSECSYSSICLPDWLIGKITPWDSCVLSNYFSGIIASGFPSLLPLLLSCSYICSGIFSPTFDNL